MFGIKEWYNHKFPVRFLPEWVKSQRIDFASRIVDLNSELNALKSTIEAHKVLRSEAAKKGWQRRKGWK